MSSINQYPLITIITPSFNQGAFLEETILSVLNQNYPNLEYIVIDGGSTDQSLSILKKYSNKLAYWISEPDKGQADAINKGLRKASGEIVAWLNSDDLYYPNTLLTIAENFNKNNDVDFIFGNCLFFDHLTKSSSLNIIQIDDLQSRQLGQFPYAQPSCFFKRTLIANFGMLNTNYHYCLDVELFIRFALNAKMLYIDEVLSKFRFHDGSKTVNSWKLFEKEWINIYLKTLRTLDQGHHIEFLASIGISNQETDIYPVQNYFDQYQIDKSVIYFLEKQIRTILGKRITPFNWKKFKILRNFLNRFEPEIRKIIPFNFTNYNYVINEHFLRPKLFLHKIKYKIYFSSLYKLLLNYYNSTLNFKAKRQKLDPHSIPIIINNFNQYKNLICLIDCLKNKNYNNIIILDNNSSYAPLLEFYDSTELEVIRLDENIGHLAFWKTRKIYKKFSSGYYVVTDPDVIPINQCPEDFLSKFLDLLVKNPDVTKVGFGLKIDDLPDSIVIKDQILKWEAQFWINEIETDIYLANIDTTFALYRPHQYVFQNFYAGIRTGGKYIARHLGWYINQDKLTEEELFFQRTANSSSSWLVKDREIAFSTGNKYKYL